jgi:hypothetical protein
MSQSEVKQKKKTLTKEEEKESSDRNLKSSQDRLGEVFPRRLKNGGTSPPLPFSGDDVTGHVHVELVNGSHELVGLGRRGEIVQVLNTAFDGLLLHGQALGFDRGNLLAGHELRQRTTDETMEETSFETASSFEN